MAISQKCPADAAICQPGYQVAKMQHRTLSKEITALRYAFLIVESDIHRLLNMNILLIFKVIPCPAVLIADFSTVSAL
jgi:hypothetical protein